MNYLGVDTNIQSPYLESSQPIVVNDPSKLTPSQQYAGAGISVGGSLLSAYLKAKAEEEMNRKKQLVEAAQGEQAMTTNAMRSMGGAFGSALR